MLLPRWRLLALPCAAFLGGCAQRRSTPQEPTPVPTSGVEIVEGTSILMERAGASTAQDTGRIAAMRRESVERAAAAAARVASITMVPDTLRLTVGERIQFGDFRPIGRDSAGAVVQGFAPRFSVANQEIARFNGPGILGMSAGTTVLRVQASSPGVPAPVGRRITQAEFPIIVRPATGAGTPTVAVDSVPRDLALALLANGGRTPVLRVGAVAEGFPEPLARGWTALGSSLSGSASTTVFVVPHLASAARDSMEARLAANGWSRPEPVPRAERGFVSSSLQSAGPGSLFCHGTDEYMTFSATMRRPGESQVTVRHFRLSSSASPCAPRDQRDALRSALDAVPAPVLRPPPDVRVNTTNGGGGFDDYRSDATATASMPIGDLLKAYATQMTEQGWMPTEPATIGMTLAAQSFQRSVDGKSWLATIVANAPTGTPAVDLSLRVKVMGR